MKLEKLEEQVKEIQLMDLKNLPPEKLQEVIDQLLSIAEEGENLLNEEIKYQLDGTERAETDNS
jgi:hypothetical protein